MDPSYWRSPNRSRRHLLRNVIVGALLLILLHWACGRYRRESPQLRIQYEFSNTTKESLRQHERLDAVKTEFLHAWTGYKNQSWMSDSLKPISGGSDNRYCGWSATLVDSLDTLYIMGLQDEFDQAVNAVVSIDFKEKSQECQVNFFESTIRHLGGLLAAYDLSLDKRLKPKVVEIAEILYLAFNTTTGMPCSHCSLGRSSPQNMTIPDQDVPLADIFSFSLEFIRVWQITGRRKNLDKVLFVSSVFLEAQSESSLPGLWPERLDAGSIQGPESNFVSSSTTYSLGALSDSAYEYLVKTQLLLGDSDDKFAGIWKNASKQIKQHLLFRAYIPNSNNSDVLFAGIVRRPLIDEDPILEPRIQHLGCFAGGLFALASRAMDEPADMDIGRALTRGCAWAYQNAPIGIMPETVTLLQCPYPRDIQCTWSEEVWRDAPNKKFRYPAGYVSSLDAHYRLRPEAVESLFVLWRLTGDSELRDIGWTMFAKIVAHTRAPYGHAALMNVMDVNWVVDTEKENESPTPPIVVRKDEMESFWLAETLKYFYLLFSDPDLISLNDFVLNTEAHPLRLNRGRGRRRMF